MAENLSLTDEEAYEIARPLARMANSSPTGARVMGPVVRNEDVIGALFALYEYNRRIDAIFDELRRGAPPQPGAGSSRLRPVRNQPPPAASKEDDHVGTGPVEGDRTPSGAGPVAPWGAPHDIELAELG
jgi:hypothetical protein